MLDKSIYCDPKVKSFMAESEVTMLKALNQWEAPPMWTSTEDGSLWVRDTTVTEVEYVAEPKADVLSDSVKCTVYSMGEIVGMFVKDKEAVAEMLETDDSCYEWFKQHVKYVWFQPAA
jgi:hypothetical protein